jgi:uncharacterized protein YjbI with pentapeptide repeats
MKGNQRIFIGLLIGALVAGGFSYLLLNKKYKAQTRFQQLQLSRQAEVIETTRHSSLMDLINNLLDQIDTELGEHPKRTLGDETIERISAVCYASKPYFHSEGDTLSVKKLSPERGALLLMLSRMNLDTNTFRQIKLKTSFSGADLRGADLSLTALDGIDLNAADLRDANLQGANLTKANLSFANLWGAKLEKAKLNEADLQRANLAWADLNETDLSKANLKEADLTSTQLRRTNLKGTILKWADLNGAFLNNANLDSADLFRANLTRTQFVETTLTNANLTLTNLTEANLSGAQLSGVILTDAVIVEENWFEKLEEWKATGTKEVKDQYKIGKEIFKGQPIFRLKKL